jgi:hypothetical protein
MRKLSFLIVIAVLLFTVPAFAAGDASGSSKESTQDGRRPKLEMRGRNREQAGATQTAPAVKNGGSTWEEFYSLNVDWNMFMDRLCEILSSDKMASARPEVAMIAKLYKDMGVFDLGTSEVKYAATGDGFYMTSRANYDTAPETIIGRALAIDNQPLASAGMIAPDDYILYIGATGLVDKLALELDALKEANGTIKEMGGPNPFDEMAQGMGMENFEQMMAMLEAMRVKEMAASTLTGEIGIVLYNLPPVDKLMSGDIEPSDIDAAVFVGLKDVEYAKNLITSFGGEMGLKQVDQPNDNFTYYVMDGEDSVGLVLGQGMGIITPNMPALLAHIQRPDVGLGIEPSQLYFDLNMAKLHDFATPLVEMGKQQMGGVYLPEKEAAYLLNLPEPSALGHLTLLAKKDGKGTFFGLEGKKALVQYVAYYLGVFGCGAAQMDLGNIHMNGSIGPAGCNGDCGKAGCTSDCGDCPNESACAGCPK